MLAVILIASLLPPENLPQGGNDKLRHFISYSVLAWWCGLAFMAHEENQIIKLGIKLIAFGAMIEVLQGLTGYRFAELYDLMANTLGVVVGLFLSRFNYLLRIDYYLFNKRS